jgi:hypothetical protein
VYAIDETNTANCVLKSNTRLRLCTHTHTCAHMHMCSCVCACTPLPQTHCTHIQRSASWLSKSLNVWFKHFTKMATSKIIQLFCLTLLIIVILNTRKVNIFHEYYKTFALLKYNNVDYNNAVNKQTQIQ